MWMASGWNARTRNSQRAKPVNHLIQALSSRACFLERCMSFLRTMLAGRGAVLLWLGLSAGCSHAVITASPTEYRGYTWQLSAIDGRPVDEGLESPPELSFGDARVSGLAGCNRFFGTFELASDGELRIGPLASTRMACPPPLDELERIYLQRLEQMRQIHVEDSLLHLSGAGHELIFRKP